MKLRFYARGDLLVLHPNAIQLVGQPYRYVGRELVQMDVLDGEPNSKAAAYPATRHPAEFDSDSPEGRRLTKLIRRDQSLWAADEETAEACGVPFVPVSWSHGQWRPD